MKLTNIERETILNFNEGEEIASIYTYNLKLQNRFDKLAEELPELISRKDNGHGAVTYELPKKDADSQNSASNQRSGTAAAQRVRQSSRYPRTGTAVEPLVRSYAPLVGTGIPPQAETAQNTAQAPLYRTAKRTCEDRADRLPD